VRDIDDRIVGRVEGHGRILRAIRAAGMRR